MTVQNMTVKNVYEGNGSATVFPYTFALSPEDGEHINVYVTDENNISRRVTNFTVDTTAKTVKYPIGGDPLPAGKRLTLRREIPAQQELNLENQGAFFAEDVESQFDRNVMMIQQLAETLQRAIVVDVASDKKPEDLLTEILDNLRAAVNAMQAAVTAKGEAEAAANQSKDSAGQASEAETKAKKAANEAQEAKDAAEGYFGVAQAWAEAPYSPNGLDSSKSSKSWAMSAAESAALADEEKKEVARIYKDVDKVREQCNNYAIVSEGWAEKDENLGEGHKSSKTWAEEAKEHARAASDLTALVKTTAPYDPSNVYTPGMIVMVENGDIYRCIEQSQGENPVTSQKWILISIFQVQAKGLPLFNCNRLVFTNELGDHSFVTPNEGWYRVTAKGGGGGGAAAYEEVIDGTTYYCTGAGGGEGATSSLLIYLKKGIRIEGTIGSGSNPGNAGGRSTVTIHLYNTIASPIPGFPPQTYPIIITARGGGSGIKMQGGLGGDVEWFDHNTEKSLYPQIKERNHCSFAGEPGRNGMWSTTNKLSMPVSQGGGRYLLYSRYAEQNGIGGNGGTKDQPPGNGSFGAVIVEYFDGTF